MTGNITQAKLDYPCPEAISMRVTLILYSKKRDQLPYMFASVVPSSLMWPILAKDTDLHDAEFAG